MHVTVLTASLPERADMLAQAVASVKAQTFPAVEHLIGVDHERQGAAPVLNRLLEEASGEWVMVCDDDDLLDPGHLETLVPHLSGDVDVVWSKPRVEGDVVFRNYEHEWDPAVLHRCNIVSHNALMRTSAVRAVGGWEPVRWFDWDLFKRLHLDGARFCRVDATTWTYRLHGSNWSQGTLAGAP